MLQYRTISLMSLSSGTSVLKMESSIHSSLNNLQVQLVVKWFMYLWVFVASEIPNKSNLLYHVGTIDQAHSTMCPLPNSLDFFLRHRSPQAISCTKIVFVMHKHSL